MVPVPLLRGVHREQVHRSRGDQPQDLRAFQIETVESGAVHRCAHAAERAEDEVPFVHTLVNRGHLIAP